MFQLSLMTLVIFLFVPILFYAFFKWRYGYWKRVGLPQLEPEFVFGNCKKTFTGKESIFVTVLNIYKEIKSKGWKHAGIFVSFEPVYFPVDPVLIKNIILKDFSHFNAHGIYHHKNDLFSQNVFNLEGEEWKRLRTQLTPTFSSGKLKYMFETLAQKTIHLKELLESLVLNNEAVNIKDVVARYTTDVIGSCAFGIECNSLKDPDCEFRKYGKRVFEPRRFRFVLEAFVPWWILGNLGFRYFGDSEIEHFYINIVKETIKYRQENSIQRKDFLQMLLQIRTQDPSKLSQNEIISQSFFFLIAGFESSSTTLTYALLNLAQNEEIQNKLRLEVRNVLKRYGGLISYEAIMDMKYLDKVVKETLRLYPPFGTYPRTCTQDYKIPGENVTIKKGTRVFIPAWGLHMDPEYYPEPDKFNPNNFDNNISKRPEFSWLPFGEGPRICLGMRFGMLEVKTGLAAIIKDFSFKLNEKTKFPLEFQHDSIVLGVNGSIWMNISKAT